MLGYSHLLDEERDQIAALTAAGRSIGAIAKAVGRAKSTVSRELRRNALPSGRYSPLYAAGAYQRRRRREAVLERDRRLRDFVCDRLAEGSTPGQIAGCLKAGHECGRRARGSEAISAFIYRAARRGEALWRYLPRRHKRRRPRRARPSRDRIKDRASIHDRPRDVEGRAGIGHWEGDLIICKRTRPVLVLHERKSRVTLATRLAGKSAAETISVMLAVFGRIHPALRKSVTFDNDTAFAQHALLRSLRNMTTWFCDAYASWQKGGIRHRLPFCDPLALDLQHGLQGFNLSGPSSLAAPWCWTTSRPWPGSAGRRSRTPFGGLSGSSAARPEPGVERVAS